MATWKQLWLLHLSSWAVMVTGCTSKPCLWTVIPNQDKRLRGWRWWGGGGGEGGLIGEMRERRLRPWQRMNTLFSLADSHNRAIITNLPCRPIHITKRLSKRLISATGVKVLHTGDGRSARAICISKLVCGRSALSGDRCFWWRTTEKSLISFLLSEKQKKTIQWDLATMQL